MPKGKKNQSKIPNYPQIPAISKEEYDKLNFSVLTQDNVIYIEKLLIAALRNKFASYNPEGASMPFHSRLLGKDGKNWLIQYSLIQSLNTTFGTSIFEPIAQYVAKNNFTVAELQQKANTTISIAAENVIQDIYDELKKKSIKPDKKSEIEKIKAVCQSGDSKTVKPTDIDLLLKSKSGDLYFIDIKTAKPNMGGFKEFKQTLLEWVGVTLHVNPDAKIHTLICIPYNPYEPEPYARWTIGGMLDLEEELKVGKEFWDWLGGDGIYEDLLICFERVGNLMSDEINQGIERLTNLDNTNKQQDK